MQIYYHRFEIEETFRDIKHIWDLHRTRLSRPNSLKAILWFVTLGIAMLFVITKPGEFRRPYSWVQYRRRDNTRSQRNTSEGRPGNNRSIFWICTVGLINHLLLAPGQ